MATGEMATEDRIRTLDDFVTVHGLLLAASGIPRALYGQLFEKLSTETFDGGNFFQVVPSEDGRQRRLVLTSSYMEKESHVFLVDHAWTFRLSDARKQLEEMPDLVKRMAALMCVDIDLQENEDSGETLHENGIQMNVGEIVEKEIRQAKEKNDTVTFLELEDLDIDDEMLLSLDLPSKFPSLIALSLCRNKLENWEKLTEVVTKFMHLKALWLNNNPILQNSKNDKSVTILQYCPSLEIYNSHFTNNFGVWALGFCGGIYNKDNPGSLHHSDDQLQTVTSVDISNRHISNLVNKAFLPTQMPSLSYLNLKGNQFQENAVEDLVEILKMFPSLTALEVDIPGPLGESAVEILESLPRLCQLNGLDSSKILESEKHVVDSSLQPRIPEWKPDESHVDRVMNAMWLYLMTYRLADEEKIDETSVWYVMDELGSALQHSDVPNFHVSPFLYMPDGKLESAISFSLLWPTKNVQEGDDCTRDFLFGISEEKQRSARLTAWFRTPEHYFIKEYENYIRNLNSTRFTPLPLTELKSSSLLPSDGSVLRVYSDIPQVEEYLSRPEFKISVDPKDADIIWTCMQVDEDMKKYAGLTERQFVNQFPFEASIVMKHHLAETVQKARGCPDWIQPTYNLETHLTQLIGDYLVRQRDALDNLWILKPWNMARTLDTSITDNISAVIRLMETGPKICQKYIEHPALFRGRKFDLRYIVLVRSIDPLDIFLADIFWARLANNSYSLDKHSFSEYETHFTVMNYRGTLNHMNTADFVREFEQEHQVKWLDIHMRVKKMIKSLFESAAVVHPEMHNPMSRAMYGVDVMLDSNFQPKLLEVTYCPDCTRACKYDMENVFKEGEIIKARDFYNYVFGCLFLNETSHVSAI